MEVGGVFATGFSWEEIKYAAKYLSMHSKTCPAPSKELSGLNFTNAKIKKAWYTPIKLPENLYFHMLCAAQQKHGFH